MTSSYYTNLAISIGKKQQKVGIVGIGYVGEALAFASAKSGLNTLGIDIDKAKVTRINGLQVPNLKATENFKEISSCDIICVCVPTPIKKNRKPDLSILKRALRSISNFLRPGQLIVIESSVAPGTTRNFALPILEKSKLKAGVEFFLAHSPERIDPGNLEFTVENTPKVVGAVDEHSKDLAVSFYSTIVRQVIPVSTVEIAELTKVLENTFRLVNISFINEMAEYAKVSGIDIWEVIAAASTKPYGFVPHYPGPGIGGDCIPVLPRHLLHDATCKKVNLRIVKAAAKVNDLRPRKVAQKAIELVNGKMTRPGHTPKVLLIGVAYKKDTKDIRQSPALKIWEELEKSGVNVSYHDPHVPNINGYVSQAITDDNLAVQDLIIITTNHTNIPYKTIVEAKRPLLDTRNALSGHRQPHIFAI